MNSETMDLQELAKYLRRDVREVSKLAGRGHLPGRKVGGEWRFARADINHWIETQLPTITDEQLKNLDEGRPAGEEVHEEPLVSGLLAPACVAVPLKAGTRASVLRELVKLAEQSWQVYDPEAILAAVRAREDSQTTAQPGGVALPHPRRPLPTALGESLVAFGRTASGIPFGAPSGVLTDLYFLILSRDEPTHLKVLARLARLFRREGFLDALRAAETPADARDVIETAERALLEE